MVENSDVVYDASAQVAEIMALLREGGWDGDDVVKGVRGLIAYATLNEQIAQETKCASEVDWMYGLRCELLNHHEGDHQATLIGGSPFQWRP